VVPEKRKLTVVGAATAAAFVLAGCAPAGYGAADYGNAAQPAANVAPATTGATADPAASADPNATSDPAANVDPNATAPAGSGKAPDDPAKVPDAKVTKVLSGTEVAKMGSVIEDQNGFVLYRFDADGNNPPKSSCNGDCAKVWPPALTNDGKPTLKGVDPKVVGTVVRADGTRQLTVKGWPVYRYIGDKKPGTWKGQNVGGKWFVIKPDGAKNLTCLPAISKPVAPPAAAPAAGGSTSGGDYSY
jgi:predicted lipoprotein with Yx(FWY)xxD motif